MTSTPSWPRPQTGPRRPWTFPPVERTRHGALTVFTCALPERPLAAARILLPMGALNDPAGGYGLAAVTGAALMEARLGHDGSRLAELLEPMGATLAVRTGWRATVLALDVPTDRLPAALEVLGDALRTPRLLPHDIDRTVRAHADGLAGDAGDPRAAARELLAANLFPVESRAAAPLRGRPEQVAAITAQRVKAHHAAHGGACAVVIAGIAEGSHLAESLPAAHEPPHPSAAVVPAPRMRVVVRHQPHATQSVVCLGRCTPPRTAPEYPGLMLATAAAFDGFTGRVHRRLREGLGYTYGVAGQVDFSRGTGVLEVLFSCPTDVTGAALAEAFSLLTAARDAGFTAAEVDLARRKLVDGPTMHLDSAAAVADAVTDLVALGLAPEEYDRARASIESAATADADRAASSYLDPAMLTVIVVGDAPAVVPQLDAAGLGPVTLLGDGR